MKRSATFLPILLFLAFAGLYGATRCPGVHLGDSGELTAAAIRLDIAHPPGYPLYTLIARLFAASSPGSPASAVNLLSSLAGAAAVALFYLLARRHGGSGPALAASLLLGLSPLLWAEAVAAEVYTLHLALFLAALLLLTRAAGGGSPAGAGYAGGLAVAAHPLGAGLLPLLAIAPLARRERGRGPGREILAALLLALATATIFLYLPIRSASNPPVDWGNPEGLRAFFAHVLRSQYEGTPRPDFSLGLALRRIDAGYRMLLGGSLPLPFLPLVPLGLLAMVVRTPRRALIPAAGFLLYGPLLLGLLPFPLAPDRVEENQVFLLPLLVFLLLFFTVAAETVAAALPSRMRGRSVWIAALLAVIVLRFPGALEANRYDRESLPEAYAREMLRSLPEGATLVAAGDDLLFPLLYLRAAENLRPDVRIVNPEGTVFGGPVPPPGEAPRYFSHPVQGAIPSGILFRDESAPPLRPPEGLPEFPRSPRTVLASGPLRVFWVNALETRARSAPTLEEAARFRLAALSLSGGDDPPPGETGLRYAAAGLLVDRGRYEEAKEMLGGILETAPGEPLPRLLLAELLLREGERERAASLIVTGEHASAASLVRSAAIVRYLGDARRAEGLARRAARKDPAAVEACELLQGMAAEGGRWDEAAAWGERALMYDPASSETRLLTARASLKRGDRRGAERHYRKLLELAPAHRAAEEARAFLNS
ncbi:MAG: DUF2723 domain-containing protein [Candidatus Eisenbacteria bacterium]